MFYQNHSLTLYTVKIFCNLILRKVIGLGLEKSQTALLGLLGSDWWIVFCDMVDWWKAFSIISSQDHCQRSSLSWISNIPQARFESAQNLTSGLAEWSCAVAITTTPQCYLIFYLGFLSGPFTNQRTAGERGVHFFNWTFH